MENTVFKAGTDKCPEHILLFRLLKFEDRIWAIFENNLS